MPPGGVADLGEDRLPAAAVQPSEGVDPGDLEQHRQGVPWHGDSA